MSPAAMPVCFSGTTPQPATREVTVTRMTVRSTPVWMAYRPDRREWGRREACGLGPVVAWDLLDTLMDFPAGMAVPAASLDGAVRRRLTAAPPGVVRFGPEGVTRTIVPAVIPLLAIITARDWRTGLKSASRFANYCRRLIVAPDLGESSAGALAAARLRGTGVAIGRADQAQVLLEPRPVPDWEPTPAWWRFCEEIYGQAVKAESRA
jgi:hypothetical protein